LTDPLADAPDRNCSTDRRESIEIRRGHSSFRGLGFFPGARFSGLLTIVEEKFSAPDSLRLRNSPLREISGFVIGVAEHVERYGLFRRYY